MRGVSVKRYSFTGKEFESIEIETGSNSSRGCSFPLFLFMVRAFMVFLGIRRSDIIAYYQISHLFRIQIFVGFFSKLQMGRIVNSENSLFRKIETVFHYYNEFEFPLRKRPWFNMIKIK